MSFFALDPGRLSVAARRLFFTSLVAATVAFFSWRILLMLEVNGWNPLKAAIFALFVILLIPLALSTWTAVIGFYLRWRDKDPLSLPKFDIETADLALPRTAIAMPIYNENPVRVFAGLEATYRSLEETGLLHHFDFYVLSDTTDPDVWVREELAFDALRKKVSTPERLIYRNRRENTERKTGNIADFCATWGKNYEYMIVFDADSFMTGVSLVNLVLLMEKYHNVGIIQAPPVPVNRRTLFGRLHQFAAHAYSLIFTTGLNFWQGGAGNYWGHNAIIRLQPFIQHCHLPKLPGKPPLGGSILSHDFIEAAFMRRAGWRVYLANEIGGSYEEMPSSLIGYAARDRRWCQGNLQHSKLLFTPGLHIVSRVHLWMGLMAYLASPLWLLLLTLTTAEALLEKFWPHRYFSGRSLFPKWHISVEQQALWLFAGMMTLLLLPKILTVLLFLRDAKRSQSFGRRPKLLLSVFIETLASTLLAPNLALLQARFVVGTLLGRIVKWDTQDRGEEGTTYREAFHRHWMGSFIGLVWAILLALTVPKLLWWFSPVIIGFLLAIPLSVWSSRTQLGDWARARGLFIIPEETDPPQILKNLKNQMQHSAREHWAQEDENALTRIATDPHARALHLELLTPPKAARDDLQRHHLDGLKLKFRSRGTNNLTAAEQRELLLDAEFVRSFGQVEEPRTVAA
jgi:membrane glycosyltransferase